MLHTVPVDVKSLVTVHEFDNYMRPPGKPLVIRGWMDSWKALAMWDFEFFRSNYGNDRLSITYTIKAPEIALQVKMEDYIDYILSPSTSLLKEVQQTLRLRRPFYCYSYKPFQAHPELLRDFSLPPFVLDWWPFFSESFARAHFPQEQGWILLGRKGVVSELHKDSHYTLTWLAQVRGRKKCFLFSPEDSEAVYHGKVDPENPEWEEYPLLREATAYECILHPGDMLFLPPDWWHHVVALDDVITVSYNLVNHVNFGDYIRSAFGSRLPQFLALLPGKLPPPQPSEQEEDVS